MENLNQEEQKQEQVQQVQPQVQQVQLQESNREWATILSKIFSIIGLISNLMVGLYFTIYGIIMITAIGAIGTNSTSSTGVLVGLGIFFIVLAVIIGALDIVFGVLVIKNLFNRNKGEVKKTWLGVTTILFVNILAGVFYLIAD